MVKAICVLEVVGNTINALEPFEEATRELTVRGEIHVTFKDNPHGKSSTRLYARDNHGYGNPGELQRQLLRRFQAVEGVGAATLLDPRF